MTRGIPLSTLFLFDAVVSFGLAIYAPEYLFLGSSIISFFTLCFASITWTILYHSQIWPKMLSPLRSLPQAPNPAFFHGQFRRILNENTGAPMREWINEIPNNGLIRYTAIFNTERVLLTSPEALREVLVTKSYDFVKPELARKTLGRLLGFGVLLAEGEEHKFQRKHLMPAFAFRHVKDLVPAFWSKSVEMIETVDKENSASISSEKGSIVKISNWLSRVTLDIIGTTGMGFDFNALHDPDGELNDTYRRIFSPSRQARMMQFLGQFVPLWLLRAIPIKRNNEIAEAAETIRRVSRNVIQEKKGKMEAANEKGTGAVDKDILSVALESGVFTDENLVDQTMTFLAAGHETTSTATTWAMLALCEHPEVQAKLRAEIREHLPSPSDKSAGVTAEQIESLPYLHAVCNEVLRYYAPVPMTRREALRDTVVCGQHIPKGIDVMLVPYAINFSRELWGDDADRFNPDRWLGKNANSGGASSNFAMLTFLHGPRSCIGQKFSQIEFACLLAALVGHYEFEMEPKDRKIEVQSGVTSRVKGGLDVRLKTVEGW